MADLGNTWGRQYTVHACDGSPIVLTGKDLGVNFMTPESSVGWDIVSRDYLPQNAGLGSPTGWRRTLIADDGSPIVLTGFELGVNLMTPDSTVGWDLLNTAAVGASGIGNPWGRQYEMPDNEGGRFVFAGADLGVGLDLDAKRDLVSIDYFASQPVAPEETPMAVATGMVQGIDVSSYQQANLAHLLDTITPTVEHVVIRFYLGPGRESPSQQITRDQVAMCRDRGLSIGGYYWAYASYDPRDSVQRVCDLAASCGVALPVLWTDVETYTDGSMPNEAWLRTADDEAIKLGQRIGAYSGQDFWRRIGNPSFPHWPLWSANYRGTTPPTSLDVPSYGDMTLVGHQWADAPCDRDVFDPSVT